MKGDFRRNDELDCGLVAAAQRHSERPHQRQAHVFGLGPQLVILIQRAGHFGAFEEQHFGHLGPLTVDGRVGQVTAEVGPVMQTTAHFEYLGQAGFPLPAALFVLDPGRFGPLVLPEHEADFALGFVGIGNELAGHALRRLVFARRTIGHAVEMQVARLRVVGGALG